MSIHTQLLYLGMLTGVVQAIFGKCEGRLSKFEFQKGEEVCFIIFKQVTRSFIKIVLFSMFRMCPGFHRSKLHIAVFFSFLWSQMPKKTVSVAGNYVILQQDVLPPQRVTIYIYIYKHCKKIIHKVVCKRAVLYIVATISYV